MTTDRTAGVGARLESLRHPRVADVGCGQGFSTLAIARAFLDSHVDGYDVDAASIADARAHAMHAGLVGRVRFV
jgi:trans-aconitate methyltransferase